jgi:hypothetical protein
MAKRGEIRGKSIARRGRDIKKFRASLPRGNDPVKPWSFQQKEYTYSPNWRDVGLEQLRKKVPDSDAKSAFIEARGDAGQMWRDATNLPVIREGKTMLKDIGSMLKFPPGLLSLIPALGIGESIEQNEENERILGDAYTDELRKEMMSPSDKEFYDKYMRLASFASGPEADNYRNIAKQALENAQVTRRVNYALGDVGFDTSAEAGVAAFGEDKPVVDYETLSGRLQSGLEGTKSGREFLSDIIPKGEALRDTGMIGDAAARIARAQEEGRAGFATPEMRRKIAPLEAVTTTDIIEEPYGEEWDIDTGPYNLNPAVPVSRQEGLDWDFDDERKMRLYLDQQEEDLVEGRIPTIDERAGTSYEPINYTRVSPFREPFVPMEGRLPGDLPPFLSGDTDWWTPEPEEEDLRGWDWINEPVMRNYGGIRPSEEIEREWPNTPPPGYGPPPPWYSRAWDWMKEGDWPTY